MRYLGLNCLSAGSVSLTCADRGAGTSRDPQSGLNCLSAGSVSLTRYTDQDAGFCPSVSQLPFGWVCFSNSVTDEWTGTGKIGLNCLSAGSVSLTSVLGTEDQPSLGTRLNCLSAGSVSLTLASCLRGCTAAKRSQLPFGWVCFSNDATIAPSASSAPPVSIAFRLGLFL